MLLAYVDESYTSKRFYLGALLVADGTQAVVIEEGLDWIIKEFRDSGAIQTHPRVEFHGKELFHGQGAWQGVPPRVRIAIYRRALRVVAKSGATFAVRGMDLEAQRARYGILKPAHEVVLPYLLESINALARASDEHVLVVADEVHSQDRYRSNFRDHRISGTPGYKSSKLERIRDTIHFAPSHHSRMLQAADLVTYLYRRRRTHREADPRAALATEQVWAEIADSIVVQGTWTP